MATNQEQKPQAEAKTAEPTISAKAQPSASTTTPKSASQHRYVTVNVETPDGKIVPVPVLPSTDIIMGLREALATTPCTCHYTCYGFAVVHDKKDSKTDAPGSTELINDYAELSQFPDVITGKAHFCMVAKPYKVRDVRCHVWRLRKILSDPPVVPPPRKKEASTSTKKSNTKGDALSTKKQNTTKSSNANDRSCTEGKQKTMTEAHKKTSSDSNAKKPQMYIRQSPSGPVLVMSKEMVAKQKANRRKMKASLDLDLPIPVSCDPETIPKLSNSYMLPEGKAKPSTQSRRQCLYAVCFSGFNPPPTQRRMRGDLQYLEIKVLEGTTFHITACPSGFFVNSTRDDRFNAAPAMFSYYSNTLLELLRQASPQFRKHYEALQQEAATSYKQSQVEPMFLSTPWQTATSITQNCVPPKSLWLDATELSTHSHDRNRAEEHLRGVSREDESTGNLRDWNDEYQCCREMPKKTLNERVFRSRVMHKLHIDFVAAAVKGSRAVFHGEVAPINPVDPERSHIFVVNNIFFSIAVDARGTYKGYGEDRVAHKLASIDLIGIRELNRLDTPRLCTLATVVIDYLGRRLVAQSIVPGILQGAQASALVYGSIDRGNTIHCNKKMHELMKVAFEKLNVRESSIVALNNQSIDSDLSLSVNSNKSDRAGSEPAAFYGPVECKGILGSDGRHYVLDLIRVTPKDANFSSDDYPDNFTAVVRPELVRLYNSFCNAQEKQRQRIAKAKSQKTADASKSKVGEKINSEYGANATEKKDEQTPENKAGDAISDESAIVDNNNEKVDKKIFANVDNSAGIHTDPSINSEKSVTDNNVLVTETSSEASPYVSSVTMSDKNDTVEKIFKPLSFDINMFTEHTQGISSEEVEARENDIRILCNFLRSHAIPSLINDINRGISTCVDGETLVQAMHIHGINLRYLGEVATLCSRSCVKHLVPYFCEIEMITRIFKRYVSDMLQNNPALFQAPTILIVHVVNCILGGVSAKVSDTHVADNTSNLKRKGLSARTAISPTEIEAQKVLTAKGSHSSKSLWKIIMQQVKKKFQYDIRLIDYAAENSPGHFMKMQLLRRISQKLGLIFRARNYNLSESHPISQEDLLDIVPVAKNSMADVPLADARKAMDIARLYNTAGHYRHAHDLAEEALIQLYQVCGASSKETAACYRILATILTRSLDSGAILQQTRTVALFERLYGLDHPETAHAIGTLAIIQKHFGNMDGAIQNFRRCIRLLDLAGSSLNYDSGIFYQHMGKLYQDHGHYNKALQCYKETLKRHVLDANSRATCLKLVAYCHFQRKAHAEAVRSQKLSCQLFAQLADPKSMAVQDAQRLLRYYTSALVQAKKQKEAKQEKLLNQAKDQEVKKQKKKRNRRRKKNKSGK